MYVLNLCRQYITQNCVLIIKSYWIQTERQNSDYKYSKELKKFAMTIKF